MGSRFSPLRLLRCIESGLMVPLHIKVTEAKLTGKRWDCLGVVFVSVCLVCQSRGGGRGCGSWNWRRSSWERGGSWGAKMFPGVNLHTVQTELLFYFQHSLVSLLGMAWSKVLFFWLKHLTWLLKCSEAVWFSFPDLLYITLLVSRHR